MLRYTRVVLADRSVYGNQAARAVPERNKAIPFSPVQGSTRHSLLDPPPGHAATCQGMPPSCSSRPQSHGSCTWPAPSGSASPWPLPGNGRRAGCCLTRRKASQNSRSEGMREFKRHLPSLPPSSMGFGCAGRTPHPQAPQQTLCRPPPDATVLVETGISQVQRSFSCSPAAGKRINSQIRVLRRRKHQRRSS